MSRGVTEAGVRSDMMPDETKAARAWVSGICPRTVEEGLESKRVYEKRTV